MMYGCIRSGEILEWIRIILIYFNTTKKTDFGQFFLHFFVVLNIIVVDFIVPWFMTPEEQQKRTELEQQINEEFLKLWDYLTKLKSEIESETDNTKKEEKQKEFRQLEMEASQMKHLIDTLSQLQAEDLQSLKTKLEDIKKMTKDFWWDLNNLANEVMQTNWKIETPETYRLLEGSETRARLLNIISSNPQNFINVEWNSPEEKLEKIFEKIRGNVVQFLENKLWNSPECDKMINSTIAPAFERNMMEMLKNQWNDANKKMLNWMDKISWNGNNALEKINNLITSVWDFATNTRTSFDKFNQWVNAVDYLAVSMQNGTVSNIEKSAVLTNPIEFKNYMNNPVFSPKDAEGNTVSFSPYNQISENIFKIDEN